MTDDLVARLGKLYTSAVHDVLRGLGHERCVLPPGIRAIDPAQATLAGRVWTVSGHVDRTRSADETLLAWTGLLSKAPGDHIVVCQPQNDWIALMGELSANALQLKRVRGYVVDGGARDVDLTRAIGFPVYCRFYTPTDIVGRWIPDRFAEPITIGEVTICTGDYLLADGDGIVVIPAAMAADVVAKTEAVASTENRVRTAILGGMDPQEAYLKYRKF
ncbi:MAG: RraA family protein [Alphaproteobacteria bacterium]|nr:RraA family protein [Alphaproteobacteria bacterium]